MRHHCRCRVCEARQVKDKHPDDYKRAPRCRQCGRTGTLRIDKWMQTRRQHTCTCGGYWFPHRRGSPYCWHRKDGSPRYPGDPDFKHHIE